MFQNILKKHDASRLWTVSVFKASINTTWQMLKDLLAIFVPSVVFISVLMRARGIYCGE